MGPLFGDQYWAHVIVQPVKSNFVFVAVFENLQLV